MTTLPPSESAANRAARRIVGRDSAVRRTIEQRFATRRARRRLVMAWSAVLVLGTVLTLAGRLQDALDPAFVIDGIGVKFFTDPLPLFLVAGALGWVVRTAVRRVADLPDEDIDERQIALRDRTYLVAYRILATTVAWLLLTATVVDASATRIVSSSVADWIMSDALLFIITLMMFLPSAILAWYAPDEVDDGS